MHCLRHSYHKPQERVRPGRNNTGVDMKAFNVPRLENETSAEYLARVSGIEWVFNSTPGITLNGTTVLLDGEQPTPAVFSESIWVHPQPQPPTPEVKTFAQVWEEIKEHRDLLQVSGIKYAGYWFHNDVKSRGQWERMWNRCKDEGLAGSDPYVLNAEQVPWKTMTGVMVPVTAGLVFAVVAAMESQEGAIFKVAEVHNYTMRQLTDPSAYDYSTGWPEVYQG